MNFVSYLVLGCLLLSIVSVSEAATTKSADRPRIGLVLGGGGARGAAHVGTLKVLDELRVPVDYVVGTSMGSIVGGLFASGMTPYEIEQELLNMDWNDLFHDAPERKHRSFRRKRDDDLYTFDAAVGFNDGKIQIPFAYIRGQKFDLELNRLTLPVVNVKNFDKLPIPYRAVATDLETGKEVVLDHGSLTRAIRASMAVPAAFDPVEIDGRLLVDGGLANNVPVSVARDMGADILIVVDVGSGLSSREEIKSALGVTGQLANFLFSLNTEAQLKTLGSKDVLIIPPLGEIGGGDFGRIAEAIPTGIDGANKVRESLKRYSLSAEQYTAHRMKQHIDRVSAPVIDFVRIDNQSHLGDKVIAKSISARPGQALDIAQLNEDIGQIYGLQIFESVRYEVIDEEGKTGLLIIAKEKHWGPGYIQAGLSSSNNFEGESETRLGLVYTLTELNSLSGEWRTGIQLGDEPGMFTELYQPLDSRLRYFINGKLIYGSQNFNTFDSSGHKLARYRARLAGFELAFGREFGTWGEGRVGYRRATGDVEVTTGTPAPDIDAERGEVFVKISGDRFDNLYFPREGNFGILEYQSSRESYGSNSDYDQWLLGYAHAMSWGQNTLIGMMLGGTTEDDNAPIEDLFKLGGFMRLSGLQDDELSGQHVGMVGLIYMRSLSDVKFMQLFSSFAGISLEAGNVWQDSKDVSFDNTITGGSLFVGFDTPIGPLYVGYGLTDTDRQSAYLYLGPRFSF